MQARAWIRLVRPRFLLASVTGVFAGLAACWAEGISIDAASAALTMAGVVALHASVDLLNDYWDHRRGIDSATQRTPASGGSGVLPEGLLEPKSVYRAGIGLLASGAAVGAYLVFLSGPVIAVLLGFAVVSIYFYSTRIVDSGLAELFVGIKGAMIVLGAYYIQAGDMGAGAAHAAAALGALSALVLFVAAFPDYAADKNAGRRTLAIVLGRARAAPAFWGLAALPYAAVASAVLYGALPAWSLLCLAAAPAAVAAGRSLARHHSDQKMIGSALGRTVIFSRAAGALLVAGIAVSAAA